MLPNDAMNIYTYDIQAVLMKHVGNQHHDVGGFMLSAVGRFR